MVTNARTNAGIDVGSKTLQLAILRGEAYDEGEFDNTPAGHKKLERFIAKRGKSARVCLEATGPYSTDVCKYLHAKGVQVVVVNPRATKAFAKAQMKRAKTDVVDARMLATFVAVMQTKLWKPRSPAMDELVAIARCLHFVVHGVARERNALHAASVSKTAPQFVRDVLNESIAVGQKRIDKVADVALKRIRADEALRGHLEHFVGVPGIGERSATYLLAYFASLSEDMEASQVVAHVGLDPRPRESGLRNPSSRPISKQGHARVRAQLFPCAMAAARVDGPFKDLFERLVAKGKPKKVALIAVERKLLVVLWTLFRKGEAFMPKRVGRPMPP